MNSLSIGSAREAEQVSVPHEVGEQLETGCQCCSTASSDHSRMEDGLSQDTIWAGRQRRDLVNQPNICGLSR